MSWQRWVGWTRRAMSLRNRLLLALLFFTAITCATEQKWSEADLLGAWSGVVVAGQVTIAVDLAVQQVEDDNGGHPIPPALRARQKLSGCCQGKMAGKYNGCAQY